MSETGIALQIGSLTIRWYGILISLAMLLGIVLAARNAKNRGLSLDDLVNLILVILPSAVIGARIYYVVFNWSFYAKDPSEIFKTWHGGLAIHGAVIFAVIAAAIYLKKKKQSFWIWTDILVPSLILGQAIGRWGNYFNGEAYGAVTTLPWGIFVDGAYHHPTFLYESLWDLGVFVVLLLLLKRRHKDGDIFAWYLILYSVGRFFVEALRTDSLMLGPLKMAQVVSVIGVLAGIAIIAFWKNRKQYVPEARITYSQQLHNNGNRKKKKKKSK